MSTNDYEARYLSLSRERKLLFWQLLAHAITVAVRGVLYWGPKTVDSEDTVKDGVQALHIVSGYSVGLLKGTADESMIGSLINGIGNNQLLPPDTLERSLTSAENADASLKDERSAAAE